MLSRFTCLSIFNVCGLFVSVSVPNGFEVRAKIMSGYSVWACKAKTYNFLALVGETN